MKKIYLMIVITFSLLISSCDYTTNNSNNNSDLLDALSNNNNYTYFIEYDDGESKIQNEVLYNNGSFQVVVDDEKVKMITLCYDEKSDSEYIIKTLSDNTSMMVLDTDNEFIGLKNKYLDIVNLNVLKESDFASSSSGYILKDESIKSVEKELFDLTIDGELSSLSISLNDGYIKYLIGKIVSLNKEYTIKIEFNSFGTTMIELPDVNESNTIVKIIPSLKLIKVESGTLLSEALSTVYLTVLYENGTEKTYNVEEFYYKSSNYNSEQFGTYEVVINAYGQEVIINIEISSGYYLPSNLETLNSYADSKGLSYGLPSTGNSKALVIPVEFIDYKAKTNMKENLEKAFFGTSEDTGWESLSSYYYESSYGKLNIEGTVLDVYNTNKTSTYYNRKFKEGENADYLIIKSALEYYDNVINYDEYDSNKDGYIDSLYIVYTTPIDYVNDNSLWWAYTYEYYTDDYEYYDNTEADFYCFLGYNFLFEKTASGKYIKLNTETIIHETGHLLGLDDYYDYDESRGPAGGLGGGDMMDYNVGDHNPFSKMLMGWVSPYIVNDTCSITLDPFYLSGKCILLTDEFSTIFDEYYLIDYYCPLGLNMLEAGYNGLFGTSGIRVYQVDATLTNKDVFNAIDIYQYNNGNGSHKLINLVQSSGNNTIENGYLSSDADLFKFNKDYILNSWYSDLNVSFKFNATLLIKDSVKIKIEKY